MLPWLWPAAWLLLSLPAAALQAPQPPPRTSTAASTEAATGEESTGTANGFTVEYGPNPETLDPALNSAIDGANTLITVFEPLLLIDQNN